MSYSFNVKAATKEAAKQAVMEKFDEVVSSQPIHVRDRGAMLANAGAVIDLLADDDTKDVTVSCNGSVGWTGDAADQAAVALCSASVACSAHFVARVVA